jgi:NAD(P)-dependent dehydrogenase (short-subunit alcohol dehydrogenase family)
VTLEGLVALISGADGHFGRPVAVALAEAGADLALATSTADDASVFAVSSIANELWALGRRHLTITTAPDQPESVAEAVRQTRSELGRLDLLVNLPAPGAGAQTPFAGISGDEWRQILQLRLGPVADFCRAGGAAMLANGGGAILNVVGSASSGRPVATAPAAAEAGVLALTRSLALEWAGTVIVNAATIREQTPATALGSLAVLLASVGQTSITGQVFTL